MPVQVTMRGAFDAVVLDEDFAGTARMMQHARNAGLGFIVADNADGRTIMLSMDDILTVTELDGDDETSLRL